MAKNRNLHLTAHHPALQSPSIQIKRLARAQTIESQCAAWASAQTQFKFVLYLNRLNKAQACSVAMTLATMYCLDTSDMYIRKGFCCQCQIHLGFSKGLRGTYGML